MLSKFPSKCSLPLPLMNSEVIPQQKEMLQTLATSSKSLTPMTQAKGIARLRTQVRAGTGYSLNALSFFGHETRPSSFSQSPLLCQSDVRLLWTYMAAKTKTATMGLQRITAARPPVRDSESAETEYKAWKPVFFK